MQLKKFTKALALALALTLATPAAAPLSNVAVAEAATVKLSAAKKTLKVGKKFTLTLKGTTKKVTWSSSKESVATVNSKGLVKAKNPGKTVITATAGGKNYTCKVTVEAVNKYVAKAPFTAKEAKVGKYTIAMPKNWNFTQGEINGITAYLLTPKDIDIAGISYGVAVTSVASYGATQENFDVLYDVIKEQITEELIKNKFSTVANANVKDFSMKTQNLNIGKVIVTSYTVELEGIGTIYQTLYDVVADGYITEITVSDSGTATTPDVSTVGEYVANSLIYTK